MTKLAEILKSKGKLGGVGLILLGLGYGVAIFLGKIVGDYSEALGFIFAGLGVFGIRSAIDKK